MKNLYELSGIKGEDVFKSTAEHPFTIRKDSSSTANETLYVYAPISFDGVTAQWGIGSATNYDVFTAVARHMIYILVAVGIIGILLPLAALISFVTKRISTPMSDLQGVVENFARLDLRADNPANVRARGYLGREDEIGAMTGDLAELANNLRATMGKINASSESVAATSEELTARTQTTAHSSEEVSKAIQNIAEGARRQGPGVLDVGGVLAPQQQVEPAFGGHGQGDGRLGVVVDDPWEHGFGVGRHFHGDGFWLEGFGGLHHGMGAGWRVVAHPDQERGARGRQRRDLPVRAHTRRPRHCSSAPRSSHSCSHVRIPCAARRLTTESQ